MHTSIYTPHTFSYEEKVLSKIYQSMLVVERLERRIGNLG